MSSSSVELAGTLLSALVTVMVLSYLWRDNVAFRIATYLFVGISAGYAGAIAWHSVLQPGLVDPIFQSGLGAFSDLTLVVPWILVLLLLFKLTPATTRLGSVSTALLVGVGAAVVVGGAITGTLIPQSIAAMNTLNPQAVTPTTGETGLERTANVVILLVGTVSTLAYFRFSSRLDATGAPESNVVLKGMGLVGQVFIAITFGVMYAGVLMSSVIVLGERLQEIVGLALRLVGG